jgi:extracellular elastinolytic metalloproteinase
MTPGVDLRTLAGNINARNVKRNRITVMPTDRTAAGISGSFVQRALEHAAQSRDALGLDEGQTPEFRADPLAQETSAGAVAVHLRQEYKSIPIFEAGQAVRFDPTGALIDSAGTTVAFTGDLDINPLVDDSAAIATAAKQVVESAAQESGVDQFGNTMVPPVVDLSGFVPTVLARFREIPERPTVFDAGPFGDVIRSSLVWFAIADTLRLAFHIVITMPEVEGQWQVVVGATDGEILLLRQLVRSIAAAATVLAPTGADTPTSVAFPRPLADYPVAAAVELPAAWSASGVPDDWVDDVATIGNTVNAHPDDAGAPVRGTVQAGLVMFDEVPGPEQHVVNGFYHACYLHDLFYLLGFREQEGNFQQDNFGRGGTGNDRVDVRVYERPVLYTASMTFPPEGTGPVLKLGLVSSTGRNTALDASVVFHEYMHGVTNRLVGGAIDAHALSAPQSMAMGEGWGDYVACTLLGQTSIGAWVTDKPGGIRSAPLDETYPGHYGLVGDAPYTNPHRIGEIWAATLLQCNRFLDRALGTGRGWRLGLQLVVDALKLSPSNPSFIDMRDAILAALTAKQTAAQLDRSDYEATRRALWKAFAQFGLGAMAASTTAELTGITADTSLPNDLPDIP